MAIEAGASDFIKKPFTIKELKVRIEHVKMQEELRAMSITDDLTGLYNRRGFFAMAEQLMKQAKRQKMGLFMLYADLDGLKTINDTWGHQEGDIALIETANILKATYRESDVIARISGDEFVVIPIGTDGDNVEAITARLHDRLEEHNAQRNHRYELTLSFGISYYDPEKPCSIDELLAHGDEMMFKQKKLKQKPYPS
jgi:diguanylate cyclase (GGDEF)-like protein